MYDNQDYVNSGAQNNTSNNNEYAYNAEVVHETENGSGTTYNSTYDYGEVPHSNYNMGDSSGGTEPPKKKKGNKFMKIAACALTFGLIAGLTFQGFNFAFNALGENGDTVQSEVTANTNTLVQDEAVDNHSIGTTTTGDNDKTATVTTGNPNTAAISNGVSEVVSNVMPAIVSITSTTTYTGQYFGREYSQDVTGSGSGIIIGQNDSEVLIVTNNHVVENSNNVEISFIDESVAAATIKGTDSSSDLAVVAVQLSALTEETKDAIKIATLGDSDDLLVGEMAIAIGNALGYGQSVTVGYISALNREIATEDYTMSLLQTDAAINPGNSGGALLNAAGEVIGINSVKYSSEEVEGMGYAIPISYAIPIIEELMNREKIPEEKQAYLGIIGQNVEAAYAERYHMPIGVYVYQVTGNSPAQRAGLVAGDVITEFEGRTIQTMEELQSKLQYCAAGDSINLTVQSFDNGQYSEKKLTVRLGSKSDAE